MHLYDDRPYLERISIFDVFVDPDARHPREMRWIAQRTWRALQDVRVDERYDAKARKGVSATSRSKWSPTATTTAEPATSARRRVDHLLRDHRVLRPQAEHRLDVLDDLR